MNEKLLKIFSIISTVIAFAFLGAVLYIPTLNQLPQIVDEMYESPKGLKAIIARQSIEIAQLELINILEWGFVLFLGVAASITLLRRVNFLEKQVKKLKRESIEAD